MLHLLLTFCETRRVSGLLLEAFVVMDIFKRCQNVCPEMIIQMCFSGIQKPRKSYSRPHQCSRPYLCSCLHFGSPLWRCLPFGHSLHIFHLHEQRHPSKKYMFPSGVEDGPVICGTWEYSGCKISCACCVGLGLWWRSSARTTSSICHDGSVVMAERHRLLS